MEATPEQAAEGLAIVRVLSAVLDRLVSANTTIAIGDPGQVTKFHAMKPPAIGIQQYLERIHKYASCSNECFILALIYIDRLIQRNNFLLTELNVHRVVITGILLAAKFFDDAYYNNAYYAKVGGVLVTEVNGLEVDFLFRINFSLHVTPQVFEKYRQELLSQAGTAGIRITPPLEALVPALQQQHQPPIAVQYTNHALNQQHSLNHHPSASKTVAQITPSPPADQHPHAEMHICPSNATSDCFAPVQRSYSEPVVKASYYASQPTRCSQTSFSAPAVPAVGLQYQVVDSYAAIDHRIYPTQNNMVHHQHVEYTQQGAPSEYVARESQHLVPNRLLAGLSGAAM